MFFLKIKSIYSNVLSAYLFETKVSVLGQFFFLCVQVSFRLNLLSTVHVFSLFQLSMESSRRGVYAPQSLYTFPATRVGEVSTLKVNFRNNSCNTHEVSVHRKL